MQYQANLLDLVLLQVELQPVTQPVASSVCKHSIWQLLAILNESIHRGVGGASVPSGRGVGLCICAIAQQITPAKEKKIRGDKSCITIDTLDS